MGNTILDKVATRISAEIKAIKTQLLSITASSIPSGIVSPFVGTIAPSGFLLCNGAEVSRITYANLFGVMGISHGQGDGTTTFNLPDYRGLFLRGVDSGALNDPDVSLRTASKPGGNAGDTIGSIQGDAVIDHKHGNYPYAGGGGGSLLPGDSKDEASPSNNYKTSGVIGSSSTETRPKNVSVNYIIKF